ncbi:MAG: hypothetical protein IPJ98_13865 [Bryobacterales bacterium]|nr:hypothetical protein [Bryobacterales bacterium]
MPPPASLAASPAPARPGFSGDGALATNATLDAPFFLALDSTGAIYFTDTGNYRVRKLTPARFVSEGVTNGGSLRSGPVAPGEIISIFGFDLGPASGAGLQLGPDGLVANSLAGTQVFFDDVPAPLLYVSAGQVNAVVPYAVAGKATTQLRVNYQNRPTNTITLAVAPSSPGVFAITNQNGSVNASNNPAAPGSVLIVYGTGEGQTSPAGIDGGVANSVFPKPVLDVSSHSRRPARSGPLRRSRPRLRCRRPPDEPPATPRPSRHAAPGHQNRRSHHTQRLKRHCALRPLELEPAGASTAPGSLTAPAHAPGHARHRDFAFAATRCFSTTHSHPAPARAAISRNRKHPRCYDKVAWHPRQRLRLWTNSAIAVSRSIPPSSTSITTSGRCAKAPGARCSSTIRRWIWNSGSPAPGSAKSPKSTSPS